MMIRRSLLVLATSTTLAGASLASGCISPTVIGGGEGGAGGAGTSVVSTGISPGTSIAVRTTSSAGEVFRVTVSNFGQACPSETPVPTCPATTSVSLTFELPVDVQPGDTLNVDGFHAIEGQEDGQCWGGGGSAFVNVEILSVDGGSLTVRLNSVSGVSEVNLEGTYNAPVCGELPLGNALAMYRYDLYGGTSVSTVATGYETTNVATVAVGTGNGTAVATVGSGTGAGSGNQASAVSSVGSGNPTTNSVGVGSGQASAVTAVSGVTSSGNVSVVSTGTGIGSSDDLLLFVSNSGLVCEDPWGGPGCPAPEYRVQIALPPAYQQPGYYSLSGIANFSAWEPDEAQECSGGGGSYWDGFIEVLYVGTDQIVFSLSGTSTIFGLAMSADGTYAAPLCFGSDATSSVVATVGSGQATVGSGDPSGAEAVAVTSAGTGGN